MRKRESDLGDVVLWVLILGVLALVLTLLFAPVALGAPAPLPRKDRYPVSIFPRYCVMTWAGFRYDATFAPDGSYSADCKDVDCVGYVGTWTFHPHSRKLVLTERRRTESNSYTYWIVLGPDLYKGRIASGEWDVGWADFSLERK